MSYFDRVTCQKVINLPKRMDLGRYAVIDHDVVRDLTNHDVAQLGDYVIRESIFEEDNQNIHELLQTIATSFQTSFNTVNPIIQKFNISINDFENDLIKYISHLNAIIVRPHYLLDKNTMKVNIGRAKRISTRSYQHLAHHSEDWEKMSALSPKPMKILHEELIVDYTVYENILLKAFLHEAIKHLNKRVKETADITKFFLSIFDPKEFENVWSDKIDRLNALVGRATKADKSKDSGATNRTLSALKAELVKIDNSQLFDEFPKRLADSVVYHDTNVLNSHKHYKYLKILWLELKKIKEQAEEHDPVIIQQEIMNNLRIYVKSLFVYSIRQMGYNISSSDGTLKATHKTLPDIDIELDKYGILHLVVDKYYINVITLGGIYELDEKEKLPHNTVCFCFSDYQKNQDNVDGIYFVNPIDTNSIECSGQVIRKLIIQYYYEKVNIQYSFKPSLKGYLSTIKCQEIVFNEKYFTYTFAEQLPNSIDEVTTLANLKEMQMFKQRNKRDQDSLLKDMASLIDDIDKKSNDLKNIIVCPKCSKHYRSRDIRYLVCDCGFVCDLSNEECKFYHNLKDDEYSNITDKGWGMDKVE